MTSSSSASAPAAPRASSSAGGPPPLRDELAAWMERERAFASARSLGERRAVAEGLPSEPSPHPEAHPPQTRLLLRAWPLQGRPALAPWRGLEMPPASRLLWARLALRVEPEKYLEDPDTSLPWQGLLSGVSELDSPEPMRMIWALLRSGPREAQRWALDALPRALGRGLVGPREAYAAVVEMLGAGRRSERVAALQALSSPWAVGFEAPAALRAGLRSADEDEALGAAEAAGARGLWELLRPTLAEAGGERRAAAARWAGKIGGSDATGALLDAALDDPSRLGDAALRALVDLHHRGFFVQPEHLSGVLSLLAAGATLEAESLAGVLFVARHELAARLAGLPADDPDWLHLVPAVAALARAPRPPGALLDLLVRVGEGSGRPAVVDAALGALASLAVDLAELPREPLEALALGRLGTHAEAALGLLDAAAGPAACAELRRRLGLGGEEVDEALRPLWRRGFEVLWGALPPGERAPLLSHVDAQRMPERTRASLVGRLAAAERDAALRGRGVERADEALMALAAVATPDDLPTLELGVLRCAERAAAQPRQRMSAAQIAGSLRDFGQPAVMGEEAEQLPARVVEALDATEARWRAQGEARPACLLAPGKRLVAELALRCLGDRSLPAATQAALLRTLLGREHPALASVGARWLGHRSHDVAKLAARLLARRGAAWLALELRRGAEDQDERRVRACLEAMEAEAGAWAEPSARRCLGHRNMNVKKTAADVLARCASAASAPEIVRWLGQSDNPGLRSALRPALDRALGEGGALAALLSALDAVADDRRRVGLLVEALDRRVDVALARATARRAPGWEGALLAALASGSVNLASGSLADLAPELRAAGLRAPDPAAAPAPAPPARFRRAVEELTREGFSEARAEEALGHWPRQLAPRDAAELRLWLRAWLDWMIERRDPRPAAVLDATLGASPSAHELDWCRRAAPALAGLLVSLEPPQRAALWPALERLVAVLDPLDRIELGERARQVLGATPGLGRSPLTLLLRAGLQIDRRDLERALDGAEGVPDPASLRRATLAEAFALQPRPLPRSPQLEAHAQALDEALRGRPDELARLRSSWPLDVPGLGPEATLAALAHELPSAHDRGAVLDWMLALRPLGVPASSWRWRPDSDDDVRQRRVPERLPPDEARQRRLAGWLAGSREVSAGQAASALGASLPSEVEPLVAGDEALARLALLLPHATPAARRACRPLLLARWQALGPAHRPAVDAALRLDASPLSFAPRSTPEQQALERAALAALWTTPIAVPASASEAGDDERDRWIEEAQGADEERARQALSKLAEAPDERWRPLVMRAAREGSARVRLHALRLIRKTLDPAATMEAARGFLGDDDPSLRRSSIRMVSHGRDEPSLPRLAELLADPIAWVRREAHAGLLLFGAAALPWVRRAHDRARPDQRRLYADTLRQLEARSSGAA